MRVAACREKPRADAELLDEHIGVWVQGPEPGFDLVIEFLPGHAAARDNAEWVVTRLVENDVRRCRRVFWPTTKARFRLIAACAGW